MKSLRHWPVWLYVPNIIGYIRIILSAIAFANYRQPNIFFPYYFFGFALDAADGLAARKLDQSSLFGAKLDMLTDRCATSALLTILAVFYPNQAPLCLILVFLDGYSHWMQMVAGTLAGTASHKQAVRNPLLRLYYWRPCLTFVCSLNEMCFLVYYMKAFSQGPQLIANLSLYDAILAFALPICILKQIISIIQIFSAHSVITHSI